MSPNDKVSGVWYTPEICSNPGRYNKPILSSFVWRKVVFIRVLVARLNNNNYGGNHHGSTHVYYFYVLFDNQKQKNEKRKNEKNETNPVRGFFWIAWQHYLQPSFSSLSISNFLTCCCFSSCFWFYKKKKSGKRRNCLWLQTQDKEKIVQRTTIRSDEFLILISFKNTYYITEN